MLCFVDVTKKKWKHIYIFFLPWRAFLKSFAYQWPKLTFHKALKHKQETEFSKISVCMCIAPEALMTVSASAACDTQNAEKISLQLFNKQKKLPSNLSFLFHHHTVTNNHKEHFYCTDLKPARKRKAGDWVGNKTKEFTPDNAILI